MYLSFFAQFLRFFINEQPIINYTSASYAIYLLRHIVYFVTLYVLRLCAYDSIPFLGAISCPMVYK